MCGVRVFVLCGWLVCVLECVLRYCCFVMRCFVVCWCCVGACCLWFVLCVSVCVFGVCYGLVVVVCGCLLLGLVCVVCVVCVAV